MDVNTRNMIISFPGTLRQLSGWMYLVFSLPSVHCHCSPGVQRKFRIITVPHVYTLRRVWAKNSSARVIFLILFDEIRHDVPIAINRGGLPAGDESVLKLGISVSTH